MGRICRHLQFDICKFSLIVSEEISINLKGFSLIGFVWILGVQPLFGAFSKERCLYFFASRKVETQKNPDYFAFLFST